MLCRVSSERAVTLCVCEGSVFIQHYHLTAFCCPEETNGRGWHGGGVCRPGPVSLEIKWKNLWYKGQLKDGLQLTSTVRLYWHKFRLERNNCNYSVIADLCIKYYPGYRQCVCVCILFAVGEGGTVTLPSGCSPGAWETCLQCWCCSPRAGCGTSRPHVCYQQDSTALLSHWEGSARNPVPLRHCLWTGFMSTLGDGW